ncbi:MAG: aldo/keto reductase [Eubacteriales bacterium]|nr:aldo/keto reductase [Eubacteriales bacterium]
MDTFVLGGAPASRIALGCMRISSLEDGQLSRLVHTALDAGINYFDHADIYGGGACEARFGALLRREPALRAQMRIQSKCGIRQGYYDFSCEHILDAVDGSLARLGVEQLDALLLHRPDALMEPEEVAEAFTRLESAGKVSLFGVSNQNPGQMELLRRWLPQRIAVDQLQFSLTNAGMVDKGIHVNMEGPLSLDHDGGVLDYCRLHDITIQPWSPFQYGFFEGVFLGDPAFPALNRVVDALAEKYEVTPSAIAIAWILRHPAKMQPVVGTTNPERLAQIAQACEVRLTRQEWYELYLSAGKKLP